MGVFMEVTAKEFESALLSAIGNDKELEKKFNAILEGILCQSKK